PQSTHRESRQESRQEFGPPPGYQPIILPGESISKYRGRQAEEQTVTAHTDSAPRTEDWGDEPPTRFEIAEREEEPKEISFSTESEAGDVKHGHTATEPEQLEWAAAGAHRHATEDDNDGSNNVVAADQKSVSSATAEDNSDYDHDDSETVFEVAERLDD